MIIVENILDEALRMKASDIHLTKGVQPLIRVNKELLKLTSYDLLSEDDIDSVFRFFVNNEELNALFTKEKKIDFNYEYSGLRLRVNVSNSMGSKVFTIRLINQILPSFSELHLPEILREFAKTPQGLILVTGKSNSGKSTTLNAIINEINNTETKKILTLESPIEYVHTSKRSLVVQKEIGEGKDFLKYSEGVKNALREDCDVLIIGEIRDRETMDAAIEMAESGHLVFGTLHTRSCAETIDRIINFYPYDEQHTIKNIVSSILLMVITQRLIKSTLNNLVMIPEIMVVDDIVSALIRKDKFSKSEIEDAIQTKMDKGSLSLIHSLARAVSKDTLTLDQAEKQIESEKRETLAKIVRQYRTNAEYGPQRIRK